MPLRPTSITPNVADEASPPNEYSAASDVSRLIRNGIDRKSTRLNSSHTVIYTLSLHDALPIYAAPADEHHPERGRRGEPPERVLGRVRCIALDPERHRSEEHTSELQSHSDLHSFPTRRSSDLCRSGRRASPRTWPTRRAPRTSTRPRPMYRA